VRRAKRRDKEQKRQRKLQREQTGHSDDDDEGEGEGEDDDTKVDEDDGDNEDEEGSGASLEALGEGGRLGRPPVLEVPSVLRLLHPKMGPAEYRWMRSDPLFMFRTARVCEACFLVYAQFS